MLVFLLPMLETFISNVGYLQIHIARNRTIVKYVGIFITNVGNIYTQCWLFVNTYR